MQFGVIYFRTWGSTQPYIVFSTLEFHSCLFVFGGTHMAPNSPTVHTLESVVSWVESF
jgi:hypothetical protein